MTTNEIVLEVGAEGGSVTLFGVRTENGWLFSRELIDQTTLMLDEPEIQHTSQFVDSWDAALALMDKYPWHKLFPVRVHTEFKTAILDAVLARFSSKNYVDHHRLRRWQEICGETQE